ncbi:MAG: hypothetical protein ACPGEC_02735 [Flavobacteriales bacterium]
MKKTGLTLLLTVFTSLMALAQPMPNQNPYQNGGANNNTSNNSLGTLSADHNEYIMIALALLAVGALYYFNRKKALKA